MSIRQKLRVIFSRSKLVTKLSATELTKLETELVNLILDEIAAARERGEVLERSRRHNRPGDGDMGG